MKRLAVLVLLIATALALAGCIASGTRCAACDTRFGVWRLDDGRDTPSWTYVPNPPHCPFCGKDPRETP